MIPRWWREYTLGNTEPGIRYIEWMGRKYRIRPCPALVSKGKTR